MNRRQTSLWSSLSLAALAAVSPALAEAAGDTGTGDATARDPRIGPERAEKMLLVVGVNAPPAGDAVMILRDEKGVLYAAGDTVASWRIRGLAPAFVRDGKTWFALQGIATELDNMAQTLRITVAPDRLEPSRVTYRSLDVGPMTRSGTGAFLNYELVGLLDGGSPSVSGKVEAGIFTPHGVGVASFVGHADAAGTRAIRLDTAWAIDDPVHMRSLRIGDSVTRGGVGGTPLRFGGIQFGRNFGVQPGFVAFPTPSLRGSAAIPSVVDVYVNNVLRDRRDVQPGPFEITNVPVVSGSGDVQLVVRDMLGRQSLVTQSYYASPRLLRQGLADYSVEAGFLRRNYGILSDDYGPFLVSGTARYGLTNVLTAEVHAEAVADNQMVGVGADAALPGVGAIEGSVAASTSSRGQGVQAALGIERRSRTLSFGVRAQVASADYVSPGLQPDRRPPSLIVQAFAGVPMPFGSLGVSYLLRNGRTEPDVELLGATASVRLGRYGTLYVGARRTLHGPGGTAGELSLILPLGPRTSGSAGVQVRDGSASLAALIQRSLPVGEGWGYRGEVSVGAIDRIDGRLSYQFEFGTYESEISLVGGRFGARVSASGGFGIVGGKVFASRELSESFATVQVGDFENVRVYADNQVVATTNAAGVAVVPRLRPFDRTVIRIEIADLPIDADVVAAEQPVRPFNRSGVAVDFNVQHARGGIARLVRSDGTPVPAGSAVRLEGREDDLVVAPGGDVYLTRLTGRTAGVATWDGGSCAFRAEAPGSEAGAQARLGDLRCEARP